MVSALPWHEGESTRVRSTRVRSEEEEGSRSRASGNGIFTCASASARQHIVAVLACQRTIADSAFQSATDVCHSTRSCNDSARLGQRAIFPASYFVLPYYVLPYHILIDARHASVSSASDGRYRLCRGTKARVREYGVREYGVKRKRAAVLACQRTISDSACQSATDGHHSARSCNDSARLGQRAIFPASYFVLPYYVLPYHILIDARHASVSSASDGRYRLCRGTKARVREYGVREYGVKRKRAAVLACQRTISDSACQSATDGHHSARSCNDSARLGQRAIFPASYFVLPYYVLPYHILIDARHASVSSASAPSAVIGSCLPPAMSPGIRTVRSHRSIERSDRAAVGRASWLGRLQP